MDEFSQYPNVLGFSVGNEVWLQPSKVDENYLRPSPTMKALIRDMKAYIKASSNLKYKLPVGIVLRDTPDVTIPLAYYYACHLPEEAQDTSADFIGYNVYRWGAGSDPGSYPSLLKTYIGYKPVLPGGNGDSQSNGFAGINVPVILTEFGRIDSPRLFAQVDWMFNNGAKVVSGGMVFRLIQRPNEGNFGLYTDQTLQTPTTNGGLSNLIAEFNGTPQLSLDADAIAVKKNHL
ncbi:hypothetical protein DGG96_11650 [Legionella qingyii]|uniref:Uncharacterized protein n=1 Tax=Legionella qingyii TaxID=2184757 RepID=A0A317U2F7_9GAMM|nr:hypothetical protein DGG96_11650 [Legionella qingyii]RUR21368.1 hypothetical protein ELY20_12785 [Legionella qingyii]RUR24592.1 hypothetical protein ELY16_11620 [Legionella qingyii]